MSALGPTLEAFFTERLIRQLEASPNTVAAYRDTMRLLLRFAAEETGRAPSALEVGDLDAPLVGAFLDHLETIRGNGVRTRNARLAAIRSLLQFAALRHPEHAGSIERALAIPTKRFRRNLVTFLDEEELAVLLAAPDRSTWTGRRDRVMLTLAAQTGLRASELTGLRCADAQLGTGAHVICLGKGRKQRITPLTPATVTLLRAWLDEREGGPEDHLFPARGGGRLSRDALERRIARHVAAAAPGCARWPRRR